MCQVRFSIGNVNVNEEGRVSIFTGKPTSNKEETVGEMVEQSDPENNLKANAIPTNFAEIDSSTYKELLAQRRKLMMFQIREYFKQL